MPSPPKHIPIEIPVWLQTANEKSGIRSKDIYLLFGFKNIGAVSSSVENGAFPKPDMKVNPKGYNTATGYAVSSKPMLIWRKSTILAEIQRRNKVIAEWGKKESDK